jgi:acetyl esterase/lipase
VRLRFELRSNGTRESGGWTIDDVRVVAAGLPPAAIPTGSTERMRAEIQALVDAARQSIGLLRRHL